VVGIGEVGGYLLAEAAMGHEVVRQLLTAVSDTREQRSLPDTDASTTKPSPTAPAHTPPLHA
jgi:hypothetical protein